MPRYFKMIITGVLFFVTAVPAWSELYQYKDQNGITRLTDTIYSVPVKYRSQLEMYSEIENLSGKMEIQPLEEKVPRQTATEKTIVPKTDEPLPVTAEEESPSLAAPPVVSSPVTPKVPPVAKPKTEPTLVTKPAQAPSPDAQEGIAQNPEDKPDAEPDGKPDAEIASHKSKKVIVTRKTDKTINKKPVVPDTDPEKPTAKALPEKTESKPKVSSKPAEETRTVKKEPPETSIPKLTADKIADPHRADEPKKNEEIPPKTADTVKKSASKIKTGQAETDKHLQKKVAPEKVTPVIEKKTVAETKKSESKHPEAKAEIKTVQNTRHSTHVDQTKPEAEIPETDTRQISLNSPELSEKIDKKTDYKAETEAGVQTREMETGDRESITEEDENLKLAHLQTTRKSLAEKKEALNKKFLRLMEEKQGLEDSVNEDDEKSVLEYNKKVKRLNIKIKQYKNEKKRLQAKIEKYNETITQSTAN